MGGQARIARIVAVTLLALGSVGDAKAQDSRPSALPYGTSGSAPGFSADYRRGPERIVTVSDHDLRPRVVMLKEGQLVAWRSLTKATSTLVFEREVARDMICHQLVNFSIHEDELRSAPLRTGEVASFCELKPGKYRYRVVRMNPHHAGAGGAPHRLEGWIVVRARGAATEPALAAMEPRYSRPH